MAPEAASAGPRPYTTYDECQRSHQILFKTFATGKTKSIKWRKWQLKQLWWMLEDNEQVIVDALQKDLARHEIEALSSDLMGLKKDILEHLHHVEEWAADEPVPGAGIVMGRLGKARIRKEPLGVVLVIGAWNFPFLLTLQPVIAAIAAGCCVVIKPSELSEASQNAMADLVPRYLDPEAVRVVTGGPQETGQLLQLKFNHIFFTGSTKVAKYIAEAAAKHLTPTVLELGGQGPAIIGASADLDLAAKRIAFAKFLNAGQICLSVNHVFADPRVHDKFVDRLRHWTTQFAGTGQEEGAHMCKIVNQRNHDRLSQLVNESKGTVYNHQLQGKTGSDGTFMNPVVATGVTMQDSLLSEELFGPICPVIKMSVEEAVRETSSRPHPLAIYVFSKDKAEINWVIQNTISGGVTVNDALLHYGVPGAPFGGVGDSGQGYYHGKYGFMAFTHQRTILELPTWLEKLLVFRYPPYAAAARKNAIVRATGFKRGETMEDQTESSGGSLRALGICTSVLLLAAVLTGMVGGNRLQGGLKSLL